MKAKATTVSEQAHFHIGVDAGYGATKAVMIGAEPVVFPSVYGYAVDIKYQASQIALRYPGDQVEEDGAEWFVGNLAMSQLREGELLRLRGRSGKQDDVGLEARARLIKAALGKLLGGMVTNGDIAHIRLATGLPVDHMREAAITALKKTLTGRFPIHTDTANFVANITEVMVIPQPTGALYSQQLTPEGRANPDHIAQRVGVIDVGMFTIDVAMDNDGEYLEQRGGSIEGGVYIVQQRITDMLAEETGSTPEYWMIEQVLRTGSVRLNGKPTDFSKKVKQFCEALNTTTLALTTEKWGSAAGVDRIYTVGGGGPLVDERVREVYPQATLAQNSQLAIAQGYANYAMLTR